MKNINRKTIRSAESAFTLVEVLVACVIGAFIAVVAVGTLKAISLSAEIVDRNIEDAGEIRFAVKMLSNDLANLYRGIRGNEAKVVGFISENDATANLRFYTVSRTRARALEPEGDVYEVEYFIEKDEDKSLLMRRYWPNPNEEFEPGGILSVIAENIEMFEVMYFDGMEWLSDWPEETENLPELIEIQLALKRPQTDEVVVESLMVNLARSTGTDIEASEEQAGEGE